MVDLIRTCQGSKANGERCGARPSATAPTATSTTPTTMDEAAEAQRLGGQRRKREKAIGAAYAVDGIRDADQAFRLLEIAMVDTLALDNGVPRNRTLVAIAQAALKAHETSELEERMQALEEAVKHQPAVVPVFDQEAS